RFAPSLPADARDALVAALDGGGSPLKSGARSEVARLPKEGALPPIVRKRYPSRGLLAGARAALAGSPARREFDAAAALAALGVPVVGALACAEARRAFWVGESWVCLEDQGDASPLDAALRAASPRERRALLERAGALAADLHAAGFVHGDLHAGNVFVREGG